MDRIILDPQEKARLQSIFDRAYFGLKSQEFQFSSIVDKDGINGLQSTMAAYRGENGLKCSIGWLIADGAYSPDLEGELLCEKTLEVLAASGVEIKPKDDWASSFLSKLQRCHDNCENNPSQMQEQLTALAVKYGLVVLGET